MPTDKNKPPEHSPADLYAIMTSDRARKLLDELIAELEWQADRKWAYPKITEKHKEWQYALTYSIKNNLTQEINECKRLKELAVKQQDYDRACLHRDQLDRLRKELENRIG